MFNGNDSLCYFNYANVLTKIYSKILNNIMTQDIANYWIEFEINPYRL